MPVCACPEQILKTARGEKLLDTVEQILQEQMIETRKLVHEGRDKIQALAEFLQRQNQATEAEIMQILKPEEK